MFVRALTVIGIGWSLYGQKTAPHSQLEDLERAGDDLELEVARMLRFLAETNLQLKLVKEAIPQPREASEICERLDHEAGQTDPLLCLARLLIEDNQVDAAEAAASRTAINLPSGKAWSATIAVSLAVYACLGVSPRPQSATSAKPSRLPLFLTCGMTKLRSSAPSHSCRFDDAQVHLNRLKSFVADDPFNLGLTTGMQAIAWAVQGRFGEARSELLRIVGMYEELGFRRVSWSPPKSFSGGLKQ